VKRSLAATACAAALILTLSACGKQTDERVSPSAADSGAAASAVASAQAIPSQAASAVASAVASTPFVTIDCVSTQAMPTQTAPNGTTLGPVTALIQPNGAPSITVATNATPATALETADMTVGSGPAATAADTVTVNYCGVGLGARTLFDSSWSRGQPATFPLSQVILGWQQGVTGMQAGGTRLLIIPGELGYGSQGTQGIAPNETLVFVVQLVSIG
jgi:peptidylprolyl isomerase